MSTETEPKYGVTFNRAWAITDIAHPAVEGEHGDCVHCMSLGAIGEAVRTGQRTVTVECDGHSMTVHEMIGGERQYLEPEEQARRDEDRRGQAALVAAGASAQDLRRHAEGLPFLCPVCSKPVDTPGKCEDCRTVE